LAEVSDIDLVVVGTARETLVSIGELRATARTVRAAEGDARRPVVVLFERSDPGGRALEAGVELAEGSGRRLIVFLPGAIDEVPPELDERLQSLGRERVSIRRALSAEPTELRSAVRRVSPAVVVLGADEAGFGEDQVRDLQRDVRCPLVVVR